MALRSLFLSLVSLAAVAVSLHGCTPDDTDDTPGTLTLSADFTFGGDSVLVGRTALDAHADRLRRKPCLYLGGIELLTDTGAVRLFRCRALGCRQPQQLDLRCPPRCVRGLSHPPWRACRIQHRHRPHHLAQQPPPRRVGQCRSVLELEHGLHLQQVRRQGGHHRGQRFHSPMPSTSEATPTSSSSARRSGRSTPAAAMGSPSRGTSSTSCPKRTTPSTSPSTTSRTPETIRPSPPDTCKASATP